MDQATNPSTTSHHLYHAPTDPTCIDQLVNIDQSQSLIDYVNRFKTANTVIFVDVDELEVHAVIDYHAAGSTKRGQVEHRAVLCLARSHEWETWNAISGHMYDQKALAGLIDVNSDDFDTSAAAALRETVMNVDTSTTILPLFFTLSIPVFSGEPRVNVKAMTSSQDTNTSKISFRLELARTRVIIEQEMARITREIASKTGVPVIMGSVRD